MNMWWSFIKSLYIDHVKNNNWKINVGKINRLAYKLMHNHKFILIDVIQMSITWSYLFVYYLRDMFWQKTLCGVKKSQLFFWNKRKMSKHQARLLGVCMWVQALFPAPKWAIIYWFCKILQDVLRDPIAI